MIKGLFRRWVFFVIMVRPTSVILRSITRRRMVCIRRRVVCQGLVRRLLHSKGVQHLMFSGRPKTRFTTMRRTINARRLITTFRLGLINRRQNEMTLILSRVICRILTRPFFKHSNCMFPTRRVRCLKLLFHTQGLRFRN